MCVGLQGAKTIVPAYLSGRALPESSLRLKRHFLRQGPAACHYTAQLPELATMRHARLELVVLGRIVSERALSIEEMGRTADLRVHLVDQVTIRSKFGL